MPDMIAQLAPRLPLEGFQRQIVAGMVRCLKREARPVLLRAPTGAGKTVMIGRAMDALAGPGGMPILWFWFAPFANLVAQTQGVLADQCPNLCARPLADGLSFDHRAGDVLIANVQQVAKADQQRAALRPKDESLPGIADAVARARAAGILIGLVVDEAHIGVDRETEFGQFCRRLAPDRMILATATPKDEKLNRFLHAAGHDSFEAFTVGRADVVDAKLNKTYIAALIYQPYQGMQALVDMKSTVLRHAWARNRMIEQRLGGLGLPTRPLLLVQVEDGPTAIPEAVDMLMHDAKVPPGTIRTYEARAKGQQPLSALAHDPAVQALVFKEAAGTGFDAPRAFVLASTKPVADMDFATQFIGRIMRVDRDLRKWALRNRCDIDPDLDTGYVYLANPDAQAGYAAAVSQHTRVKSRLEGAVEKLYQRQVGGHLVLTNRETAEPDLAFPSAADPADAVFPPDPPGSHEPDLQAAPSHPEGERSHAQRQEVRGGGAVGVPDQGSLPLPAPLPDQRAPRPGGVRTRTGFLPASVPDRATLERLCAARNLRIYELKPGLPALTPCFQQEHPPGINDTVELVRSIVRRLPVPDLLVRDAVMAATGRAQGEEVETDLVSLAEKRRNAWLTIHRDRMARDAHEFLCSLAPLEASDATLFIQTLAARLADQVQAELGRLTPDHFYAPPEVQRLSRDAAHMLTRRCKEDVRAQFHAELSERVRLSPGNPVPAALIFPEDLPLQRSPRNIYGIVPPTKDQIEELSRHLTIDESRALQYRTIRMGGQDWTIDRFDATWSLNDHEREMAKALDSAGFVLWWHRNPERKLYSARVMRADSHQGFYPDFVLGVRYWDQDEPSIRLVETKRDSVDAAAKAQRDSKSYGRVIFLRQERGEFRILERNGTLGPAVGEGLRGLKEALMQTAPARS